MNEKRVVASVSLTTYKFIHVVAVKDQDNKNKNKHKHMVNHKMAAEAPQSSEYSFVYSYLAIGIILLAVVFVVIPRVAAG